MCVFACVRATACVDKGVHMRACISECVRVCGWADGCWCTSAGVCLRVFRLTYPVCKAQSPYCLCPLWLHHIFLHYLINGRILGEKSHWTRNVFWFSLQLLFETFRILRTKMWDVAINVKTSSCKVPGYFCWILMKLQFFKEKSQI